jgi:hypothetical protein
MHFGLDFFFGNRQVLGKKLYASYRLIVYTTLMYAETHMGWTAGEGLGPRSVLLSRSQVQILPVPLPVLSKALVLNGPPLVDDWIDVPWISRSLGWIPGF